MLRVRLLGDLTIEVDGTVVDPPASRRARALLGWLALDRRMHGRSGLAAKFWPDVLDESARTSLRSALSALRRAIGPDSERYLIATRDEVGLADGSLVWTDVAAFNEFVADGRLEDALELGAGELLAGLDEDWVYEWRDEHRDRVAGVLSRLAADAERDQDLERAIGYTRRQVALDPLAEEPQRELMRRLAAVGDRAAAVRAYDRLAQRFRDELRIVPSQATRDLAEQLRRGGEAAAPQPAVAAMEPAAAVVTLLFTDLVGSTALLSELGDDEAEQLRRVHFGLLRDVAAAHGGQEVKNLGDGLMVAFPSAVNAVGCAIGIQQAVHRHNTREGDERLRVRVGLHVGEPIRDEGDYFGTPVVIAKRLCDRADGGQILASELMRGLVGSRGGFEFHARGPMELKGIAEPLPAVEVGWKPAEERRVPLPPPFLAEDAAPLVGREQHLEEIARPWLKAREGARRVAMLVGEPGIGKTRLATEFCRSAYADGALVLLGRCYEESLVPYQPFVEALRHYVSESTVDELRLALGPHRATLAKLLPELGEGAPQTALVSSADSPEREQFLLFDAVSDLLRGVAAEQPLILVLDDLHWADAPSLQLLRHVVRATEGAALLILGAYRETEVDEPHPLSQALADLRRARALDTVTIGGLGEAEIAALISVAAGRDAPEAFTRSVADRTQGNPFFVEELLRDVGAEGDLEGALTQVPESVKDLLLRRMRRLDDSCGRLLTVAAVSGREFALEVLEQVTATAADEVAETLEQAIAAQIVEESAGSIGRYGFAHALIRETIYEQLSLTRRAGIHRKIGEAIESLHGADSDEHASALAYHFSAAGDAAKGYRYHLRASAAAQRVYAVEPALAHSTAALAAAAELGIRTEDELELRRVLIERGLMKYRTGEVDGGIADFEAALDAARRAGDRATEMEALNALGITYLRTDIGVSAAYHEAVLEIALELDDRVAATNAFARLAVVYCHRLEFKRALELGERALEQARAAGDEVLVGRAIDSVKLAVWQLGDLDRLEDITGELARLWRERNDLWYLQFALLERTFVPIGRARWDEASERLEDAAAINRRIRDPLAEILMLEASCWLFRSRGEYQEALTAGRQAIEMTAKIGWKAWAAATLGWTLLDLRAADEAAEVLERGVAAEEGIGATNDIVRCLGQLAWAHWLLGDHEKARALCTRAAEMLHRVTAPPEHAFLFGFPAYAAVARVLLASGEPEGGEALVRPLLAAAQRSGWREAEAMSALVLGLCLEARAEQHQARELLAHAASVADEYGIPAPGWEAHAALARIGNGDRDQHARMAEAIIERIAAGLSDDVLRDSLRRQAGL
jgi:class 3 adenylate cyclase